MNVNLIGKRQHEEEYLFLKMEAERARIPNVLRDEYLPVFVVKCLREKLVQDEGSTGESDLQGEEGGKKYAFMKAFTEDSCWTDNSFLEDNVDFEGVFLLSEENLNFVGRYLKFAKNAMDCFSLNKNNIGRHFTQEFEYPCLELLYMMDSTYNILPLEKYLLWLKAPSQIIYFRKQFLSFVFSPMAFSEQYADRSNRILQRFMQCIIITHYCNPCSKPDLCSLKNRSEEILRLITSRLLNEGVANTLNHKIVLDTLKDVDIPGTVRIRYFTEQIKIILQSGSKPFLSGTEILRFQEKYAEPTKLLRLEMFTFTVTHMISVFRTNDIFEIINAVLATSNFNWEVFLVFITVWVQEKQTAAASLLKDLIKTLIRNGLVSKDENDVIKGFIIARHCSIIAAEAFSRYEHWFKNMFHSETFSVANEPETFSFLVEMLTKWLPTEPSCFLSAHITFWPFTPKGCRDIWTVYVSSAKERITEYQEVEEAMEYEPNPNDPIQHAIVNAIKTFESNGKIPKSILSMQIFNRQQYVDVFLPALLRKPTNVSLTDSRLRLIELLKREGKIPDDMYAAYKALKAS